MANGKIITLTVTSIVTVGFLLASTGLTKVVEIDNKMVERIKIGLGIIRTFGNLALPLDDQIKLALNTTIGIASSGADITYGLLVLSAMNEFDMIDLVTSQRYKAEARDYFNSVLDERANLGKYALGIGFDIPRVALGAISGQISGLTMNTFSIIDKMISIFTALNVVKQEKLYDGLWRYFDSRRTNENHLTAWEDAKADMGIVVGVELLKAKFLRGSMATQEVPMSQLALQFATLWGTWEPYTDPFGVTPLAREKFKEEMRQVVLDAAARSQNFVQQRPKQSLFDKAKTALDKAAEELARIKNLLANLIGRVDLKAASGNLMGLLSSEEIFINNASSAVTAGIGLSINQEGINDLKEQIDLLGQKAIEALPLTSALLPKPSASPVQPLSGIVQAASLLPSPSPSPKPIPSPSPSPSPSPIPSLSPLPSLSPTPSLQLCEKVPGALPTKNKVILNEIAWMGTANSANDEWIELKNISATQVDLTGWQVLDKEKQIKIVFAANKIATRGLFLLERTNEETVPGVAADLIYTGGFSNTDEALYFFDKTCQLQDEVTANSNWPAGDNSSKRTMERKSDLTWQTSSNPGGTPKSENSSGYVGTPIYTGGGGNVSSNSSPSPSPSPPSYLKILISEVQISPITERFIELYNPNNSAINLTNWYIQRKTQAGDNFISLVSKTYFNSKTINAYSYFLISRSASSEADIVLDDLTLTESNVIQLKNPNGEIADKIGWGQAQDFETSSAQNPQPGQTIGRKWVEGQSYQDADNNSADFEIQFPTPKAKNETFRDIIAPETTIDSKPPGLTNQTQAVFTFSSNEENSTFECKLDEGNWQACFSPQSYSNLLDGPRAFQVRAKDISQNTDSTPAQHQWQIDSASPQTEILTHPPPLTNQNQANFIFSSNEENSTFECKSDEGDWETCETPKLFSGLSDGERAFFVRAKDAAQNLDSSPAQYVWTIDTLIESPALSLADLDSNSFLYTNERKIKATISHDEEAASWLLSESETAVENPDSPWQSEKLSEFILSEGNGPKTVFLWIKDESENISSGISAQIILDTTPALVQFGSLAQIQTSTGFNISWSASDALSGILEYHLKFREESETEPENWQTISGQNYQFSGLNGKTYYFKIRAKDNAGNLSEWSSEISTKIEKPILEVSPTSLEFEAIEFGQNPANKNLAIGNLGFGDLNWKIVLSEVEWLSVNLTSGQASSNVSVSVNISGLEAGQFQTKIKISSSGGEKEISVILNLKEDIIPPQAPTITSHSQSQILNSSPITLAGQTEVDALILIFLNSQNAEVMADENSDWQKEIELIEGQNLIEIRAKDEAGNESQPATLNLLLDTHPPTVAISELPDLEPHLSFTISWSGNDGYQNLVTSGIDGFQLRYSEDGKSWTYWPSENEYMTSAQYNFTGADGKTYYFQVKAGDKAGNKSNWQETSTQIKMPFAELSVVINEIAWMGTKTESNDEWIEFYNNSSEGINLEGWIFRAIDGTPEIELAGVIQAQSYFLLERTDDNTISGIPADLIYTGALENNGEKLELFDPYGNVIDSVDYSSGWVVGDNDTKQTMERINSNQSGADSSNWANNNLITRNGLDAGTPANKINGTPRQKNSVSTSPTTISSLPFNEFSEIILTELGNPYIIQSTLIVPQGKSLKIEPGVILKFVTPNYGAGLQVNGALKAIGQESKLITFTRYEASSNWPGIYFSSTSENSILDRVIIEKARSWDSDHFAIKVDQSSVSFKNLTLENYYNRWGILLSNSSSSIASSAFSGFNDSSQGSEPSAIYLSQGNPAIKNSTFKKNTYGIKIKQGASPIIEGNYFEENEKPIYASDSYPSLTGNQFLNNNVNGILIKGDLSQNTIWKAGITYVIDNSLTVASPAILTIEPGTIIKFKYSADPYARGKFIVSGQVLAQGTDSQPIVFTAERDKDNLAPAADYKQDTGGSQGPLGVGPYSGDWSYIQINSSSQGSVFENIIVRYGGVAFDFVDEKGAFRILGSSPVIKNSIFDNNRVAGIYLSNANNASLENLVLRNHKVTYGNNNNPSVATWIKGSSLPSFSNLEITNNSYGVYWPGGTCQNLQNITFSGNTINSECGCCPF